MIWVYVNTSLCIFTHFTDTSWAISVREDHAWGRGILLNVFLFFMCFVFGVVIIDMSIVSTPTSDVDLVVRIFFFCGHLQPILSVQRIGIPKCFFVKSIINSISWSLFETENLNRISFVSSCLCLTGLSTRPRLMLYWVPIPLWSTQASIDFCIKQPQIQHLVGWHITTVTAHADCVFKITGVSTWLIYILAFFLIVITVFITLFLIKPIYTINITGNFGPSMTQLTACIASCRAHCSTGLLSTEAAFKVSAVFVANNPFQILSW